MENASDPRLHLSIERTALALERTQLAWVRTLLSMIGGGFVIDKGLEAVHQARIASGEAWLKHAHSGGLIITGFGTILMIIMTVSYFMRYGKLREMKGEKKFFLAPAFFLSVFTVIVGISLTYFIFIS